MKTRHIIVTFDGMYHDTKEEAIRHLHRLESDQLFKAVDIIGKNCQDRTKTICFIGENHTTLMNALIHLENIRNDFTLTEDEN